MASIQRFEDIEAWKKARQLRIAIRRATRVEPFCRDYKFCAQITDAALSVMSNIAEGFERDGNAEFRQHLYIAKGSVGEVRSQLYAALDDGYIDQATFDGLMEQAMEVSRLIKGFIRYLDQSGLAGSKFA
ncbi:MAG TPA: four helix bundle protein [Gemmataceae bacterium]|nr:four helix bundle protein [Gemmataceae bacterium]